MAVPEQIPVVNYVADGIIKKFDVPFEYDQQSDLHVYVDGTEPTIDKYYFDGNAFNFYIAPTSGQDVKIKRITPKERDTDYNLHTNTVRPKALNTDFDRLWYVLQEVFSDVGGLSQAVQDEIIARIQGDEDLLNQLTAEISARMLGDEAVTEDLKNYVNQVIGVIIGDPSFNGIDADKVNDASGETQQQVNYNGGSKWHSRVGGYKLNEHVVLTSGDIVKSTIDGNTNDPNVDMTGWENFELNTKHIKYANYPDAREFGIIPDKTTDWTSEILEAVATIPESSTFYIPQGTLWQATSNPDAVYAAMPNNTTILDDSGYESRYSYSDPSERWQASQQIYYKTKNYGAAGRRNGNGLNIRSDYHSYLTYEIDALFGTGGCKGSVIFRFNNGTDEMLQIGANGDSVTEGHFGIASYGGYSNGVTALRVGMQSSIAPHSFAFNSAMVDGTSYIFGKRIRKTNPLHSETEAEWQAANHITRYAQPTGHTGNFEKLYYYGATLNYREILDNTGRYRVVTKNSKTLTTTADGEQFGAKLSVLAPTANTLLSESLSGSYYSNVSTGGTLTITLPKAVKGVYFDFSIDVAQNLVIAPNAADNFTGMVAGKTKTSNTLNSKLRVVAISATQWAFTQSGAWTDQA